jgi:Do/DeqQ family serine protease
MSKRFYVLSLILSSIFGGLITLTGAWLMMPRPANYTSLEQRQKSYFANYQPIKPIIKVPEGLNFTHAASLVRSAVVHIKITYASSRASRKSNRESLEDMFRQYHGNGEQYYPRQSSGSGVIISDDGYIATNNHVIDDAGGIQVVLNDKRTYQAKVIGTDAATDLALLKIEEKNLPFVHYGNSDGVQVGDWVLAIGNPFDLTSTVTAGIVSAKGRNINLLEDNHAIEAFIQTDAVVNPGNSGGALVNLQGELIGVNTAIATHTGYYAGYSFAIPINLVKKVMDDLMNFGETQRALLGVTILGVDADLAKQKSLKTIKGVYVDGVSDNGAAKMAGLRSGDIILAIDKEEVNSSPDLQSIIGMHRPGDKVEITYNRLGQTFKTFVTLRNKWGNLQILRTREIDKVTIMGAEFSPLNEEEKKRLGLDFGVKVISLGKGKIKESGMRAGFIVMRIEGSPIKNPQDIKNILQKNQPKKRTLAIDGIYPNGTKQYYAIGWDDK